jgi:phosphatidylglycerol lysyltransferase
MKRRWLFWLLFTAFIWVVITRMSEIRNLADILVQGQWEWVLVAVLLQMVYYVVLAASYQSAFWAVEVKGRLWDLLPVTFAALFVNVVAPSGSVSGMAVWADDSARRGQSAARTMAGVLLQLIADFSAFTLILIVGMVYLFIWHDLKVYEVIGAAILLGLTIGLCGILALGLWRPGLLKRLLSWLQGVMNGLARRLKRANFLEEDWAEKNATEFTEASIAIGRYPKRLALTLGIAFIGHLIDLTSLYVLFLAFHQPVTFGVLVAGYAMGILFWIVSPTPQGIGVVEGMMALVFTSLHVPSAVATTVTLAFRGLSFWLPLLVGFIILRRMKTFGAGERTLSKAWDVRLVAIVTALFGIVNVISAVTPSLLNRAAILEQFMPLVVRHGSRLAAAVAGFALLLLAGGVWRRKRMAWIATLIVLFISAVSHLIKGLDYEEALLAVALAVWLWVLRYEFHARSDQPSVWQGLRVLAMAFIFTLGYGMLGFYLLDKHYSVRFGFDDAFRQTVVMFTQFYNPGLAPTTRFGRYFADSIYFVGIITFAYAAFMLLRPVFFRQLATSTERERAEKIVSAYGRSSLARMTLLPDLAYYFSSGGSLIAYVVKGRIAVGLGDPIGPKEDLPLAIAGFKKLCEQNDWEAAFYQTLPETLAVYEAAGFRALCVGQEGVVDLHTFSIEGHSNKGLRSAYNRLSKAGYQVKFHQSPLSDELLEDLREISDEWLTMMHGSEKRFSLGWFEDDYIRNSQVAAVHNPEGWITAFANLVPEYQLNEATIDLMRRLGDVEPGTMDFLFVGLFNWAREQGYDTFDLGLSALSGVGEQSEDPVIEQILHFVYEHVNQFYNFKGLHEFKEKFHPGWSRRYLIYQGVSSLPAVWVAVVAANSGGDDFLFGSLKKPGK